MGRVTSSEKITSVRIRSSKLYHSYKPDTVAVEEPLDIRLNSKQLAMTMRTPGHDVELIHGFLHAEGYIEAKTDVYEARYCDGATIDGESGFERNTYNVMDFSTRNLLPVISKPFTTNSACGICGSTSIDQVKSKTRFNLGLNFTLEPSTLISAQHSLLASQGTFAKTGGVHAAALFTLAGEKLVVREDVGRHNAVDKVIGWALMNDYLSSTTALDSHFMIVSSRASFEIVQKAAMAGITTLACVSAPSSLAIETAKRFNMTLIGFLRSTEDPKKQKSNSFTDGRFNIYAGIERINLEASLS